VTSEQLQGKFYDWMRAFTEGKEVFPNCDGEKHHYVAQFQLGRFRGKGRLYQLYKETGEVTETTPKEAAWNSNLYTVQSTTGEHDGIVERFFALAENFAVSPGLSERLVHRSRDEWSSSGSRVCGEAQRALATRAERASEQQRRSRSQWTSCENRVAA
jgi:hypothetical protein